LSFRKLPWLPGSAPNWQNHRFPGTSSFVVELRADRSPRLPQIASLGQSSALLSEGVRTRRTHQARASRSSRLVGMRHALIVATVVAAGLAAVAAGAEPESRSLGFPWDGRLVGGVQLASDGPHFFTWDPIRKRSPNRPGRRFGSGRLIQTLLRVLNGYAAAHPDAPRVGIGDLSRQYGGDFGPRFGPPGHASHQDGLDVDVYYPRRDRRERAPVKPRQIDRVLAQALLDRFVSAGAEKIFVGPHTGLDGPAGIVEVLPSYHDNHMHVRLPGD